MTRVGSITHALVSELVRARGSTAINMAYREAASATGSRAGRVMAKYLEDFREGEVWQSGSIVIGEDEMIAYAKANDPQPIHVDPDAAKNGPFGGIIASGWQIAALSMRLFIESGGHGDSPIVGIGIDELRWKQAVRPGDTLRTTREIVEVRRSVSRPDRGVVRTRVTVLNQRDETVMTYYALGQVRARNKVAEGT